MVKFDGAALVRLFAGMPVPVNYVVKVRRIVKDVSSNFEGSDMIRLVSRG